MKILTLGEINVRTKLFGGLSFGFTISYYSVTTLAGG